MLIVRDMINHAGTRKLEWIMTGLMIHLGLILVTNENIFNQSRAFSVLAGYMSEHNWAILFLMFGSVRLAVLILNGTHIRPSAEIRAALAAMSFVILCMWIWGIISSGFSPTGALTYKWMALGELLNVWQASTDMEVRRRSQKNGNGRTNLG